MGNCHSPVFELILCAKYRRMIKKYAFTVYNFTAIPKINDTINFGRSSGTKPNAAKRRATLVACRQFF